MAAETENKHKNIKKRNPVFALITAVLVAVLAVTGFLFRYSFFTKSKELDELLILCESFLDGMSNSVFFLIPSTAGTVEAYSAVFSVTGVKEIYARIIIIGLESLSLILMAVLSGLLLDSFYSLLCAIVLSVLPFLGIGVDIYEELAVLCLLLFEISISLTRKYEAELDPGIPAVRYFFIGILGGLSVFLLPGNIILIFLSLLLSLYFLAGQRGLKLLLEFLIALFSGAAVFFLLITMRVMNTALETGAILRGYLTSVTDMWGMQYLFTAVLLLILFIIETIEYLLKSGNKEYEAGAVADGEGKDGDIPDQGDTGEKPEAPGVAAAADRDEDRDKDEDRGGQLKKMSVSTGSLPSDFVLHRAGDRDELVTGSVQPENKETAADPGADGGKPGESEAEETPEMKEKRIAQYRVYAENINPNDLEFDFDIPEDDDFDIEVKF